MPGSRVPFVPLGLTPAGEAWPATRWNPAWRAGSFEPRGWHPLWMGPEAVPESDAGVYWVAFYSEPPVPVPGNVEFLEAP